ncbi:hypothetical protein J4410_03290 [Candidatus Woesearchaeota archaeon]|nr:hypothetical protein [Candidatus Woesearchaeota archaeon]
MKREKIKSFLSFFISSFLFFSLFFPLVHAQSVWIAKLDQVSLLNEEFGRETQISNLRGPTSITATLNKMVWIAERENNKVYHYTIHGDLLSTFHRQSYRQPQALAASSDQGVWIAYAKQVVKLDQEGKEEMSISGFVLPQDLVVTTKGHVWIADTGNNRLVQLNEKGKELISTSYALKKLAYDSQRDVLWGLHSKDDALYSFTSDGTEILKISGFFNPQDIALCTSDGSLWVADANHNELVHLSSDGQMLHRITKILLPKELAVFEDDFQKCHLWVVDQYHNQLVLFGPDTEERERLDYYTTVLTLHTLPREKEKSAVQETLSQEEKPQGNTVLLSNEGVQVLEDDSKSKEDQNEKNKDGILEEQSILPILSEEKKEEASEIILPPKDNELASKYKALLIYSVVIFAFCALVYILFYRKK